MSIFNLNKDLAEENIDTKFWKIVNIKVIKRQGKLKCFKSNRKTHFYCSCGNQWTTAKSLYIFNFHKNPNLINLCLYNQKCQNCESYASEYSLYDKIFGEFVKEITTKLKNNERHDKVLTQDQKSKMKYSHDFSRCAACLVGLH